MSYAELCVKGGKFQLEKEIFEPFMRQINWTSESCGSVVLRKSKEELPGGVQTKVAGGAGKSSPVTAEKDKINTWGSPGGTEL